MENSDTKKEIIKFCFQKNVLVNPLFLSNLREEDVKKVYEKILKNTDLTVLDESIFANNKKCETLAKGKVNILFNYQEKPKKRTEQDFISYFNTRYKSLEKILKNRIELQDTISINKALAKKQRDDVSLIGLIESKQITKNNNLLLGLEDPTGKINILITKTKKELFQKAQDLVEDETIGVTGVLGNKIVFVNNILWPDVPVTKEYKKSDEEGYAVFISDIHVGSNLFLEKQFNHFVEWLNGNVGNEEHKEMARKVKYVFIVGDLIDGCGIYPGQDEELIIKDIYEQYKKCAELLSKIPCSIKIIISPGNHDALRLAEPQPQLYMDFAKSFYDLPNVVLVSNPALVNIDRTDSFEGFDVLMYHGYSFDYYFANVDSIRTQGGYDRPDLLMKFLLQRRHLAPTHASTLYLPDSEQDPLIIDKVPDFFVTGHIHKAGISNYKNITLICASCWQAKTLFQDKVGHHPEPARVPVVNLKTRKVKVLKF